MALIPFGLALMHVAFLGLGLAYDWHMAMIVMHSFAVGFHTAAIYFFYRQAQNHQRLDELVEAFNKRVQEILGDKDEEKSS